MHQLSSGEVSSVDAVLALEPAPASLRHPKPRQKKSEDLRHVFASIWSSFRKASRSSVVQTIAPPTQNKVKMRKTSPYRTRRQLKGWTNLMGLSYGVFNGMSDSWGAEGTAERELQELDREVESRLQVFLCASPLNLFHLRQLHFPSQSLFHKPGVAMLHLCPEEELRVAQYSSQEHLVGPSPLPAALVPAQGTSPTRTQLRWKQKQLCVVRSIYRGRFHRTQPGHRPVLTPVCVTAASGCSYTLTVTSQRVKSISGKVNNFKHPI